MKKKRACFCQLHETRRDHGTELANADRRARNPQSCPDAYVHCSSASAQARTSSTPCHLHELAHCADLLAESASCGDQLAEFVASADLLAELAPRADLLAELAVMYAELQVAL